MLLRCELVRLEPEPQLVVAAHAIVPWGLRNFGASWVQGCYHVLESIRICRNILTVIYFAIKCYSTHVLSIL